MRQLCRFCNSHFLLRFRMSARGDSFFAVHFMLAIHVEIMHAAPLHKAKLEIMFVPIFRKRSQILGVQNCLSQCPANYVLRRQILQNIPSHKYTDIFWQSPRIFWLSHSGRNTYSSRTVIRTAADRKDYQRKRKRKSGRLMIVQSGLKVRNLRKVYV